MRKLASYLKGYRKESILGPLFKLIEATFELLVPLVIAALIRNFLQYAGVQAFLSGVRPCVVAMILATSVTMGLKALFRFQHWGDSFLPDWKSIAIFAPAAHAARFTTRARKLPISPCGTSSTEGSV